MSNLPNRLDADWKRVLTLAVLAVVLLSSCDNGDPYTGHLEKEIPPCTPVEGSSVDPCEPDVFQQYHGNLILEMRFFLEPLSPTPVAVSHIVLRGTYLPGTVRCNVTDYRFRQPPNDDLNDWNGWIYSTAVRCYVDVRVNAYILGSGPPILTVLVDENHQLYHREHIPALTTVEEMQEYMQKARRSYERMFIEGGDFSSAHGIAAGGIEGVEAIMFIGPSYDVSPQEWKLFNVAEAWEVFCITMNWDVERRQDGDHFAVHPIRNLERAYSDDYDTYRSQLEMELPAFKQAVMEAHQERLAEYEGRIGADEDLPLLVTDANQLRQFYVAVGAYDHEGGPLMQPPPPCGLVVSNQLDNPDLMTDCFALLAAKDMLRGTGSLNWDIDTTIADWDGVTVEGTPKRVTKLLLANENLTGSIPDELGDLSGLQEIRLSGNSLTGCIPVALQGIPTNDLSSLNLLYCQPP